MFGWISGRPRRRQQDGEEQPMRVLVPLAGAALLLGAFVTAQPDATVVEIKTYTQELLTLAYPELPPAEFVGAGRDGLVSLDVLYPAMTVGKQDGKTLVAGNVRVDQHRILELSMLRDPRGTTTDTSLAALRSEGRIETLSALEARLRRIGARYPPSERGKLVEALNLPKFAPVLGEFLVEPVVSFMWNPGDWEPRWAARIQTQRPNGERQCHSLEFEVFSGRFMGMLRMPAGTARGTATDQCWPDQ